MAYTLYQVTASTTEPVSIAESRSYARISDTFEDALLGNLISAARQTAEVATHRQILSATYQLLLDDFPAGGFSLPRPPCTQVTAIEYVAAGEATDTTYTTVASTDYHVDLYREPARVIPRKNFTWPDAKEIPNAVKITYNAGYTAATIPRALAQGIMLLVNHWHENREPVVVGGGVASTVPISADRLFQQYRFGDIH